MITRELFSSKTVEREDRPPLTLFYYILQSDGEPCVYGAEIVMECAGAWRSACINDITTSEKRITALVQKISLHRVTPCTLEDIVLDLLNKY